MKHLILGNGPAGVVAAETLRKLAPGDAITLLGDEPGPPYSRMAIPYLLMGNIEEPGTWLRKDPAHFERLGIALKAGRAASVDAARREVRLESGETLAWDRLLVATGSRPNRPPDPGHRPARRAPLLDARGRARDRRAGPQGQPRACRWARASSAASSWKRSPPAASSSSWWRWATGWCRA